MPKPATSPNLSTFPSNIPATQSTLLGLFAAGTQAPDIATHAGLFPTSGHDIQRFHTGSQWDGLQEGKISNEPTEQTAESKSIPILGFPNIYQEQVSEAPLFRQNSENKWECPNCAYKSVRKGDVKRHW